MIMVAAKLQNSNGGMANGERKTAMKRIWPMVAVKNVVESSAWYPKLLNAANNHPGGTVFNQIVDKDGTVLLCLHHWGPSGLRGDHHYPSLSNPDGNPGKGLLLWFVVDDFDEAWTRAQAIGASIAEPPNTDNGTFMRAFVIRDPDGYYVAVNETR